MPYELQQSGSGWVVINSETGKPKSRKPLTRERAVAQLRALYASVPDARTKAADVWAKLQQAGAVLSEIIGISSHPTKPLYVNVGDWATDKTMQAIKKTLGSGITIEAESAPGGDYTDIPKPKARTKAAGHTGVMLALFVPASALERVTALQADLPNPEPAEDLHLTLAYLGKTTDLYYQRGDIERMLGGIDWVSFGLPLAGRIGGIGRFHHDEGDGTNAVYASFDAPGLPAFRQRLVEMLKGYGIMPAENHGYTPHITLAYVPIDQDIATTAPEALPELVFGALTLAWGDERIEFGPGARMKAANFGARAGETIAGNLGRGGNGQFTRAGSAATPPSKRDRSTKRPAAAAPAQSATPQKPGKGTRTRGAQTNRRRVAAELKKAGTGVGPKSMAAMEALRAGKLKPEHLKTLEILAKTGMVQKFGDGGFALTEGGRIFLNAADKGDTKAATAAISTSRPQTKPGKGSRSSLTVTKDASGRYRWLTFSSTAFRDRDGEIVSTKALADDVARADADGTYGPLRWWHAPGIDLGDCDFNAMHGRTLIESGTFRDERYGPLVAAKAHELGVSIGFTHAATEPDADKVFHSIRRFERSLMPLAYPSNLFTGLVVKETPTVEATKIAGLKALGFDDTMIAAIETQAQAREKAAETAGITFKEADAPPAEAVVETVETAEDGPEQVFFGDLTLDQADAWMRKHLQPHADAQAAAIATKAAREDETQTALKAAQQQLSDTVTRIGGLEQDLTAAKSQVAALVATVKELQGEVPAGVKRASQDATNIATKEQVEAFKGPAADPMNDFLGFVTGSAG